MATIYEKETEKWLANPAYPNIEPPSEMSRRMPRYDALCNMEPKTPEVCCLIILACWAGVQVIQNHELAHMPESDMGKIMRGAHQRVAAELFGKSDTPDSAPSQPPVFTLFPEIPNVAPGDRESKATTDLIGEVIRYRTLDTDEISEFRIVDYGKTHVIGEWFVVTDVSDERERRIMVMDMYEILANRTNNRIAL